MRGFHALNASSPPSLSPTPPPTPSPRFPQRSSLYTPPPSLHASKEASRNEAPHIAIPKLVSPYQLRDFLLRPKKGRKEEERKKKGRRKEEEARRDGKKESLPIYRRTRLTRRQKAANTFENLLKMQEQRIISHKYDFFAHKVYYASLLCNLETKNCIYRFVN